jgi:anthranilate synthase component II
VAKIQKDIELLIIDNQDSFTWNLVQLVEETKIANVSVVSNTNLKIEELLKYDGIILSPGPGLPKEHDILYKVVQNYASTKPILGVCLGMQLIAEVFGGKLRQKQKIIHGEQQEIYCKEGEKGIFKGIENNIKVGLYHSWIVEKETLPQELEILAETKDEILMAIKHHSFPVWGVQFHPESILTPQGETMIRNWIEMIL